MFNYQIWKDGEKSEAIEISANDGNEALDKAAQHFGYIDYADMAQELEWDSDSDEGLNIVQIEK